MLTERRAAVLRSIVDEYIDSAQPVASRTVALKYLAHVSPATIRNEMMRLEEEGYISQPHTSAGRVPSDKGYRYYVERLMREEAPSREMGLMVRHQFHQVEERLEDWARLAAVVLSAHVQAVAVVTAPRTRPARLRWLELVKLQELLALLVVVLQHAQVRQQLLALPEAREQDELSALARSLSERFAGLGAQEVRSRLEGLPEVERSVMEAVASILEAEDRASHEAAAVEGLRDVLHQPEFEERERVLGLLEFLEGSRLGRLLPFPTPQRGQVQVIIGSEHPEASLRHYSVVAAAYGLPGAVGAVALVGPTRLRYGRAVGMVRFVASLLDELIAASFGG
ncbi:Heat-inducible transcription repressor HrcA [bacterium HR24]|jgi:heat-inducible transcriptional repressor|nr:Heat-inducible transcription repressor HrcA [bacterium HR24]